CSSPGNSGNGYVNLLCTLKSPLSTLFIKIEAGKTHLVTSVSFQMQNGLQARSAVLPAPGTPSRSHALKKEGLPTQPVSAPQDAEHPSPLPEVLLKSQRPLPPP